MENKTSTIHENGNDANRLLSAVPFSYDWWFKCGKEAYWKAENLVGRSYYYEVAYYCQTRCWDMESNRHSR